MMRLFICLPILVATFLVPGSLEAAPLEDFMKSREFGKYRKVSSGKDLLNPRWLKRGTSFYSIFAEPEGGRYLLDWLGVSASGYSLSTLHAFKRDEYVGAERVLVTPKLDEISVRVLVPHPKFRATVDAGLIDAFSSLEPPVLKAVYSKEVSIGELKGTMYETERGACSLLIRVERESVVNIAVKSCELEELLVPLAQKLDFKRLNDRLTS